MLNQKWLDVFVYTFTIALCFLFVIAGIVSWIG